MDNIISGDIMTQWQDMNPLSTLHDVMTVMKPELSVDIDITEINGGTAGDFNNI